MDAHTWVIWQKCQSDPEYALLFQQMYNLEARFETVMAQMPDAARGVIRDYVMHCEAMSWRILEFACEELETRS